MAAEANKPSSRWNFDDPLSARMRDDDREHLIFLLRIPRPNRKQELILQQLLVATLYDVTQTMVTTTAHTNNKPRPRLPHNMARSSTPKKTGRSGDRKGLPKRDNPHACRDGCVFRQPDLSRHNHHIPSGSEFPRGIHRKPVTDNRSETATVHGEAQEPDSDDSIPNPNPTIEAVASASETPSELSTSSTQPRTISQSPAAADVASVSTSATPTPSTFSASFSSPVPTPASSLKRKTDESPEEKQLTAEQKRSGALSAASRALHDSDSHPGTADTAPVISSPPPRHSPNSSITNMRSGTSTLSSARAGMSPTPP